MSPSSGSPVLVVGAGPVGLTAACELLRHGVGVRLIDALPAPTTESRAIIVHARSLEMLERIGVVDELIATGVKATIVEMHVGTKTIAHMELDGVDSPFPFSVVLPQTETERILAARFVALGGEVERGVSLIGFDQDDDGVTARLRRGDGQEETASAPWIIGTDGSHSTVREQTGQRLEGSFQGERFLLADVDADHDLDLRGIHTFFPPTGGPFFVMPMRGSRMRLIAQVPIDDSSAADAEPTIADVQKIADERAGGITVRAAHWLTMFDIHHAQVPQYRVGRALLAGDAAHVHSPAGGQGMNTGMQDAFNLGWKVAAVERGADPSLLDSYQAERHPVAERVLKDTTLLTHLGTLAHRSEQVLRNHLIPLVTGISRVREKVVEETSETDITYRGSPIVDSPGLTRGEVRAGDSAPDVEGLGGGVALHTVLAEATEHTVLHVVAAGAAPAPAPPAAGSGPHPVRQVLVHGTDSEPAGYDEVVVDPDGRVADRYGFGAGGGTIVVRPDGYLGYLGPVGASVDPYFERITG